MPSSSRDVPVRDASVAGSHRSHRGRARNGLSANASQTVLMARELHDQVRWSFGCVFVGGPFLAIYIYSCSQFGSSRMYGSDSGLQIR